MISEVSTETSRDDGRRCYIYIAAIPVLQCRTAYRRFWQFKRRLESGVSPEIPGLKRSRDRQRIFCV